MKNILVFFCFFAAYSHAATIDVRLSIETGSFTTSTGVNIDYKVFTESGGFASNSDILIWNVGDVINLKVVNNDGENHGFMLDGWVDLGTIAASDSAEQQISLTTPGVFRYFDPLNGPYNEYLGLSGIAHVKAIGDLTPYFYWDIREHQEDWNASITAGGSPNTQTYNPSEFTINGNYNPNINTDPMARPVGNVANEFKIVIVNNGMSIHSLHFHGYHLLVDADSRTPSTLGRSKDTFPVYPKEHLVLSCTPDKPGTYPVHDHNLVAVTGGSQYANGMFLTLMIAP